jgi:DNA-binding transcriptional MocR family regulator
MRADALATVIAKEQPQAVYLMPTLNNPTGVVMPLERRLELVEVCRAHDLVIIDDDAYGFFLFFYCDGHWIDQKWKT